MNTSTKSAPYEISYSKIQIVLTLCGLLVVIANLIYGLVVIYALLSKLFWLALGVMLIVIVPLCVGMYYCLRALQWQGPVVIFDRDGMYDLRLDPSFVAWQEIEHVHFLPSGQLWVSRFEDNPEPLWKTMARLLNLRVSGWHIQMWLLQGLSYKHWQCAQQFHQRYRAQRNAEIHAAERARLEVQAALRAKLSKLNEEKGES